MAAPMEYADKYYLNLHATLADGTPKTLKIDRYLNADPKLALKRAQDGDRAKDALLSAIGDAMKINIWKTNVVQFEGTTYDVAKLHYVFVGKGSPQSIRDVVWLASRLKLTDATKVVAYVATNIGLDCNGFTRNFWGADKDEDITWFDEVRRQAVQQVAVGDAMIFFHTDGSAPNPYHIAVVDEVNVIGDEFQVLVAQSAGLEQGLEHHDYGKFTPQFAKAASGRQARTPAVGFKTAGDLFVRKTVYGIDSTIFFARGPDKGDPNV